MANNASIVMLLLISSCSTPFQLFMNECLAVGHKNGNYSVRKHDVLLISVAQIISCYFFAKFSLLHPNNFYLFLIVFLQAFNTFLSFKVSLVYYSLVINGYINTASALIIGSIPGLVNLFFYFVFGVFGKSFTYITNYLIIFLAVIPTVGQWFYLNYKNKIYSTINSKKNFQKNISFLFLFKSLFIIGFLTFFSTHIRESLALLFSKHFSVILVMLNSTLSLINAVTRSYFFSNKNGHTSNILLITMLFLLLAILASIRFSSILSYSFGLLFLQVSISYTIEQGRKMSVSNKFT